MKRFTDKWITNLKPKSSKQEFNAGDGFLLRVGVSGSKVFYYRYKIDGKKKFLKLGTYPDCPLEEAKNKHLKAWTLFKNGNDPQCAATDITTVGDLVENWYEKYILVNRKTPGQIRQQIDADIAPLMGIIKLSNITTRKLTLALEKIVERGSPVHANKVLSSLKQAFNYAISKGIYTSINPLQNTKALDIGGREKPRERNLSMEEIKQVWVYLDSDRHKLSTQTICAIKLIILAGSRLSEVRDAYWSEFDFDKQLWTIPKERYKTGIEHKVYLTSMMIELLIELKKLSEDSIKILPTMGEKSLGHSVKRSQERIGIEKWTLHDLRRTLATRMADTLGIDIVVIEKLLGHKLPKIMATYQKDEMLSKRQDALEQWSDKIQMLVNNDNVVVLKTS